MPRFSDADIDADENVIACLVAVRAALMRYTYADEIDEAGIQLAHLMPHMLKPDGQDQAELRLGKTGWPHALLTHLHQHSAMLRNGSEHIHADR